MSHFLLSYECTYTLACREDPTSRETCHSYVYRGASEVKHGVYLVFLLLPHRGIGTNPSVVSSAYTEPNLWTMNQLTV